MHSYVLVFDMEFELSADKFVYIQDTKVGKLHILYFGSNFFFSF